MPFKPGNPGRPKGTPNRIGQAFRTAVLKTYWSIGGDQQFAAWAFENQTEFYRIAARLIPQELAISNDVVPLVIDLVTKDDVAKTREMDAGGE